MLADHNGFERITEDEAIGATALGVLAFAGGVIYVGEKAGSSLGDGGSDYGTMEVQPVHPTAAPAPHAFSRTEGVEIVGGVTFIGAVLGGVAVSLFRRRQYRRKLREEELARSSRVDEMEISPAELEQGFKELARYLATKSR
ncbi:MAG TPA: hypothetical protein VIJ68_01145 [Candidatus Saccharimonadales bacterium]